MPLAVVNYCIQLLYFLPTDCACSELSSSPQCNDAGVCDCINGGFGPKCNECERGYSGKRICLAAERYTIVIILQEEHQTAPVVTSASFIGMTFLKKQMRMSHFS